MTDVFNGFGDPEIKKVNAVMDEALGSLRYICGYVGLDKEENIKVTLQIASWSNACAISDETAERLANVVGDSMNEFYTYKRIATDHVELTRRMG